MNTSVWLLLNADRWRGSVPFPVGDAMTIKDEWQSDDGSVRLILGDSMVILPTLNEVGAVVTDPPYGVGASGGMHSRIKAECKDWDDKPADVRPILSLSVPTIIW